MFFFFESSTFFHRLAIRLVTSFFGFLAERPEVLGVPFSDCTSKPEVADRSAFCLELSMLEMEGARLVNLEAAFGEGRRLWLELEGLIIDEEDAVGMEERLLRADATLLVLLVLGNRCRAGRDDLELDLSLS